MHYIKILGNRFERDLKVSQIEEFNNVQGWELARSDDPYDMVTILVHGPNTIKPFDNNFKNANEAFNGYIPDLYRHEISLPSSKHTIYCISQRIKEYIESTKKNESPQSYDLLLKELNFLLSALQAKLIPRFVLRDSAPNIDSTWYVSASTAIQGDPTHVITDPIQMQANTCQLHAFLRDSKYEVKNPKYTHSWSEYEIIDNKKFIQAIISTAQKLEYSAIPVPPAPIDQPAMPLVPMFQHTAHVQLSSGLSYTVSSFPRMVVSIPPPPSLDRSTSSEYSGSPRSATDTVISSPLFAGPRRF